MITKMKASDTAFTLLSRLLPSPFQMSLTLSGVGRKLACPPAFHVSVTADKDA